MLARTLLAALVSVAFAFPATAQTPQRHTTVSFSQDILPIFQIRCGTCHSPGGEGFEKSGLDLRSYQGLMKGTQFGPVVVVGDDQTSNLIVLLDGRADKSLQMPHNGRKLTTCDRDLIRTWIREGAQDN